MRRLHILVEGQTEETVVRDVIAPHFERRGWVVTLSILVSKRMAAGSHHGGVAKWSRVEKEARTLLTSGFDVLTTVVDYYGVPSDVPGLEDSSSLDASSRVQYVERAMVSVIGDGRFLPHLVLHETEAWVLAAGAQLATLLGDDALGKRCQQAVQDAGGPELVDDGESTAPSKRLLTWRPKYRKTVDGPAAIAQLGLDELRRQCPHTDVWLRTIELRG